jgi:alpha-D-xyloside xylohydrolase
MNRPIDWSAITVPLDVSDINASPDFVRRWLGHTRTDTGLVFHCQTAAGRLVDFRVDVYAADVFRFRMNPEGLRPSPADMLSETAWPPAAFSVDAHADLVALTTDRMRLEWQRFPWQMRGYALDTQGHPTATPFFSERIDDRAYGPGYEVAPLGFEPLPGGGLGVREALAIQPGEALYGFGEKFTRLDKWGQEFASWAVDAGNVSSQRAYKNIPFFMSTAGYGLFIHSSFPIVYRLGTESAITYSFHIEDSQLDYFLFYGPELKHILRRYTDLTGRAPLPPKWSFGFWLSRAGYRSRAEVETVAQELRRRGFPCDVLSLDPWWMGDGPWCTYQWSPESFPEPEEMIRRLRAQGLRTCLWITPYVPFDTPLYREGAAQGYFVRQADGQTAPALEAFAGGELAAVDFSNPAAVAWYKSKLAKLLDQGVAAFKTDFGEQAPVEAVYHDGRSGLEMHNLYPLLYNRAVFELSRQRFGRGLVWGRSAYAGSQRYPVQWGGDSYSSLDQLASQLLGLLSYGLSGVPFCSHDVGGFDYAPGFFDQATQDDYLKSFTEAAKNNYPKDAVTYVRWLQMGVFSSHVRAHGKQPHEPWSYGAQAEDIARDYLRLRYRLLPYIYSQAVKSTQTGLPMVRPLVLEFQDDVNTRHLDQQYLFGDSFLVAPVLRADQRCQVYLPSGQWVNYWTKEVEAGGRWLPEQAAPLEQLPLWVRAGAIIPFGPDQDYAEQKSMDPLTLEFYAPQTDGDMTVADEDQPGIPVHYRREVQTLHVEVGACPGQLQLVLYGLTARSAHAGAGSDARPLLLTPCPGGCQATLNAQTGASVIFIL